MLVWNRILCVGGSFRKGKAREAKRGRESDTVRGTGHEFNGREVWKMELKACPGKERKGKEGWWSFRKEGSKGRQEAGKYRERERTKTYE